MKTVHLARGLTLPAAELATEVVASLGQRGGGKSNGAAVVAEGLLEAGIQVIVLDHVGIWFSLRLDETGKRSSPYQIPVLGGQHGDIALVASTGKVVAEALARSGSSAVLDVSSFSKGDRCRFAADFAEAFFSVKKLHPGPVQILLEEAQRYVPQKLFAGQGLERMLGAFEEIAEVGRNYGIGLHLISQRPQKINKDVLNLADTVLAYRTNGVLERKAISDWVQEKGAEGRKEMHDELPGLERGTAIVWSPNRKIYGQFAIDKKSTYDAGATPTHARAAVRTKRLDLESLESVMGAAVEEAKANDPRVLKARIAELEREVTRSQRAESHVAPVVERVGRTKRVEVPVFREADLKRIERFAEKLGKREDSFKELIEHAVDRVAQAQQTVVTSVDTLVTLGKRAIMVVQGAPPNVTIPPRPAFVDPGRGPRQAQVRGNDPGRREADTNGAKRTLETPPGGGVRFRAPDAASSPDEHIPEKCQRMLAALRQGEATGLSAMPFKNVAIIAGVAWDSGTTSNRKRLLLQGGYMVGKDIVQLTEKGRAYPLDVEMPPRDRAGLLAYWKREIGTDKISAMLDFVVTNGRASDAELAKAADMVNGTGSFSNYKRELTGRGLMARESDKSSDYVPSEVFNR